MNPSDHMHHHRQSSTLSLKFAETKKVKEVVETDMEEEEEEEEEEEGETEEEEGEEFEEVEEIEEEELEQIQLKKKRMDLDGPSEGKRLITTTATATATASAGGGGGGCGGGVAPPPGCRVEKCKADLSDCKKYHRRHRVCEYHAKAQDVMVDGLRQRFCQQCSRFHELPEFDDTKRSCRRRLEGHNARRRKNFAESSGEGSGRRASRPATKKDQCRQIEERGRSQMVFPKNHQNLHIH